MVVTQNHTNTYLLLNYPIKLYIQEVRFTITRLPRLLGLLWLLFCGIFHKCCHHVSNQNNISHECRNSSTYNSIIAEQVLAYKECGHRAYYHSGGEKHQFLDNRPTNMLVYYL